MKALYEDAVDPETDTTSEDEVAQLQETGTDELLSEETKTEDEDQGDQGETDESRLEKKDKSQCRNSDKTENDSNQEITNGIEWEIDKKVQDTVDRCYKTRKGRVTKRKQPVHTEQPKMKCVKTEYSE